MTEDGPADKQMPTALKLQRLPDRKHQADERADWIGQELRKVFEEALDEPIPDRLKVLLQKLQSNEESKP
jgi:hypothetical protein